MSLNLIRTEGNADDVKGLESSWLGKVWRYEEPEHRLMAIVGVSPEMLADGKAFEDIAYESAERAIRDAAKDAGITL